MSLFAPISTEEELAAVTPGTDISGSQRVRLVNITAGVLVVTLLDDTAAVLGTFSLVGGKDVFIKKNKTDTLFTTAAGVKATVVAPVGS